MLTWEGVWSNSLVQRPLWLQLKTNKQNNFVFIVLWCLSLILNKILLNLIVYSFSSDRKTYADAQKTCETAALNGFTTGRLLEPKTHSFIVKVYAETKDVFGGRSFWIGIKASGGSWVYTSTGTEVVFKNFDYKHKRAFHSHDCISLWSSNEVIGKWRNFDCTHKFNFICEFV